MQYRVRRFVARTLRRTGALVESLSLAVLRPADVERIGRDKYGTTRQIERWASGAIVDQGWNGLDREMVAVLPSSGRVLVLFAGGGRDALAFAERGYEVAASDVVPAMVDALNANAVRRGLAVRSQVADAEDVGWLDGELDVVWLGCGMYSSIPGRGRRVALLRSLAPHLRPGGLLALQYMWIAAGTGSPFAHRVRRITAAVTGGYRHYEPGDVLWRGGEFLHAFRTPDAVVDEAMEAGFDLVERFDGNPHERLQAGAVFRRRGT